MLRSEQTIKISEIFFNRIKQLDQVQRLQPSKLKQFKKEHFKLLYPHKEDVDGVRKYTCCESCTLTPGYFCCCQSNTPQKEFVKFGLSICLYFKYIKHSIVFFAFMSLIAILSCFVCYEVALQNGISPMEGYSTFLFSTTYGSFSSEQNKCQYRKLNGLVANFDIQCPSGYILGIQASLTNNSLNSLQNCRNQRKSQEKGQSSNSVNKVMSCNSENSRCQIQASFANANNYQMATYTYECTSNFYSIGKIRQRSSYYFYFVVAVDVFITFFFIFFLQCQIASEQKQAEFFKKYQLSLEDFSIKIKGFQTCTAEDEVEDLLQALKDKYPVEIPRSIVQFTFSENEEMLKIYEAKFEIFNQISELIKKYYLYYQGNQKLSFKECHDLVFDNGKNEDLFHKYKEEFEGLLRKIIDKEIQRTTIQLESTASVSLYLVFNTIQSKKLIGSLRADKCCAGHVIKVGEKYYSIEQAPNPDMMIWQNKFRWTGLRVVISWIFTLIICAGSYLLFGYIQFRQKQLFDQNNYGVDCDVLFPNGLDVSSTNYLTCKCKKLNFADALSSSDCSDWARQYALYKIIPLLISLGIVVYNIIVTFIFRLMGKFERHKTLISEEVGFALKRAFLLILNMGLIMILLNYNYKNSLSFNEVSFVFLGRFDDFSSDWYQTIATIIILTMIFNIATPITEFLLSFVIKCLRKCWDTRCCRVQTSKTTKSQYLQYFGDDKFPIGQRYAYLIATFFISFSFSGVMPILVPVSTISYFLLYHSDKILIFKFYQTPINYTQSLNRLLRKVLALSLISHLALTAYFLTEKSLVASSSTIPLPNEAKITQNTRIHDMLTIVYIYPYLGLLALIIIYIILSNFCGSLLSTLYDCCCKRKGQQYQQKNVSVMKRQTIFWSILSKLQLQNLLKVSEYSLERFRSKIQGNQNLVSYMTKNINIRKTQNNGQRMGESILKSGMDKLKKSLMTVDRQEIQLIGLPSYEFLIKSDKLTQNAQMMKIELQLKDFYKSKLVQDEIFNQIRTSSVNLKDASATNLRQ